jgi:hypothetical protein
VVVYYGLWTMFDSWDPFKFLSCEWLHGCFDKPNVVVASLLEHGFL